jgi:hypothetical protein
MRTKFLRLRVMAIAAIAASSVCAVGTTAAAQSSPEAPVLVVTISAPAPPSRGLVLPALYLSLGALEAYDGYSTSQGIQGGASEGNPLMGGVAGNPAALWAVKAGATIASIYVAERLWRQHHRGHAIALLAVANGIMAFVAASNASILRARK